MQEAILDVVNAKLQYIHMYGYVHNIHRLLFYCFSQHILKPFAQQVMVVAYTYTAGEMTYFLQ